MQIIKDRKIIDDEWLHVEEGELPEGDIILSLESWKNNKDSLLGRNSKIGVLLQPDEHPSEIKDDLSLLSLVAINFPSFVDGRGYSYAKILKDRYKFIGEIRAVGDVLRDQLSYMERCGFNSFETRSDRNIKDATKAFDEFSVKYQVSADEKTPLYRKR